MPKPRSVNYQAQQGNLFNTKTYHRVSDQDVCYLAMSEETLQSWRQKVSTYQHALPIGQAKQSNLLPSDSPAFDPDIIAPFALKPFSEDFYRIPQQGDACIYFVIDRSLPILLYIGQTIQSRQRWQGGHGCKQYLHNYRSGYAQYQLPVQITMAFWWEVPIDAQGRQKLEKQLILKWRSPFNRENWHYWNTPFVH